MKMVYETPKMKVEGFRTDAYCAACGNQPYFTGWLSVVYNGVTNWFFGNNKIAMLNQNQASNLNSDTREQYYYKQVDRVQNADGEWVDQAYTGKDPILYLEYSAPYNTFVLYQESGNSSGYYSDYQDDWNDNRSDPDDYDTFVSGSNSLQVYWGSTSSNPDFVGGPAMSRGGTRYYQMDQYGNPIKDANGNYTEVSAERWYSDKCLGAVSYTAEEGFQMIPS